MAMDKEHSKEHDDISNKNLIDHFGGTQNGWLVIVSAV